MNSDHPSPISPGHYLISPILANVVNNVLNKFIFILNSGSPILWTKPGIQGSGSAKKGLNPNRTGPRPVYMQQGIKTRSDLPCKQEGVEYLPPTMIGGTPSSGLIVNSEALTVIVDGVVKVEVNLVFELLLIHVLIEVGFHESCLS